MRTVLFTTSFWNDSESAQRQEIVDPVFGLRAWHARGVMLFSPVHSFVACGTWSDPAYNPLSGIADVVNAGIPSGRAYNVFRYQYSMAAYTAAMAHLLNRSDWDLAVLLDTDCLVGSVDFPRLLSEFDGRSEVVLSNAWSGCPGGPFMALKREGCIRLLHHRTQGNMVLDDAAPDLQLGETEMRDVFGAGWWNPWPEFDHVRQDWAAHPEADPMAFWECPFVRQPHPSIIQRWLNEKRPVPL